MRLSLIIFIALAAFLFFSCGRKEYTEQGILEIKKEIDSLLHKPEAEEHFDWGSKKAYSNFRAYFHKSKMIFINEDFHYRQPGESFNRYYFKDGNLLYFIGKEISYMPEKQYKNIELMVDPNGNVIAYDRVVNGERSGLDSEESELIINHAKELEKIVSSKITSHQK
ncbi:MAG: hypothetical protein ACHQLA_01075 [Ignavibacteriales bacterium]